MRLSLSLSQIERGTEIWICEFGAPRRSATSPTFTDESYTKLFQVHHFAEGGSHVGSNGIGSQFHR